MALSSVTRYPGGVSNAGESSVFADLRFPTSWAYNVMQDDFNAYTAANWTIAGTAAGVPALVTGVLGDGGVLGIPTTGTNPSETSVTMPQLTVVPDVADDLIWAARVRLSVADAGMFIGLSSGTAATPVTTPPNSGIYITKAWTLPPAAVLRVGGVTIATVALPPMINDTWHTIGMAYTAADGALRGFLDNTAVRVATGQASLGTLPLGLVFSVKTEAASIRNLVIDKYLIAKVN